LKSETAQLPVFGWSRFGCRLAADRDVGPVDLGFLGPGRFAAKALDSERWISLDFLGFSRPNRAFSMGYAAFSRDNFSRALPWR
jgi:hypothetical protein